MLSLSLNPTSFNEYQTQLMLHSSYQETGKRCKGGAGTGWEAVMAGSSSFYPTGPPAPAAQSSG